MLELVALGFRFEGLKLQYFYIRARSWQLRNSLSQPVSMDVYYEVAHKRFILTIACEAIEGEVMDQVVVKMMQRLKVMTIILFLISSFFCLLVYDNILLRREVTALKGGLQAKTHEFEALTSAYERLLGEREALNASYSALQQNCSALFNKLREFTEEYVKLMTAYSSLNSSYASLLKDYITLQQQVQSYAELQGKYETLLKEYQKLQADYSALKAIYDEFYFAVFNPLWPNKTVTPTLDELRQWLAEDDTNNFSYSEWDFICGDFAVMLSLRAKLRGWDMGIVAVLGRDIRGGRFNHAFNAIRTVEGIVYIEPQNDRIFYGPIREGTWYTHPGFGRIYVEAFIMIVPYQPPL